MKVIGRDQVVMYDETCNCRQTPGAVKKWQDSTWLHWWTTAGIYRHVVGLPLRDQDKLPNGWGGGDDSCRQTVDNGVHNWIVDDKAAGVSAELHFRDFHAAFRGFPRAGKTSENIAPDHIDVGGRLTGTITMQGRSFKVTNGMGVRDHGWGHRDIKTMLSHRYVAGTFSPEYTFCA
jgi:hypothetical protein